MVLVKIVLFPQIFLDSSYLSSHCGFLFLASASFGLQLVHHIPELVFHGSMKGSDALFFFEKLIPDQSVHRVVFRFVLHFLAHLLL